VRTLKRRFAAALALVLAGVAVPLLGGSEPASASCAPPVGIADGIAQADLVVVGTVASARSGNRVATVHVEEVWKGDVGESFEVFGGPAAENALTSVDRKYEVGRRYLLFAREPAAHGNPAIFGGRYEDNDCSTTQAWTDTLLQYRPATARIVGKRVSNAPPVSTLPPAAAARAPHDSNIQLWVLVAAVGSALLLTIGLIRRRNRPAASSGSSR
jgi:hypothetical protein